jgi:hypothetical protein
MTNPWAQWGLDPTQDQDPNNKGSKDQAISGLRFAARQLLGQDLDDAGLNEAATAAGYSGSGDVSGEQYNKALGFIRSKKQPNQAPAPQQQATQYQSQTYGATAYKPSGAAPSVLPPHMQVLQPQFAQYQPQNTGAFDGAVNSQMQALLASGGSLGEQQTNQMKMQAKESAMSQADALKKQALGRLRGQGFEAHGGTMLGANAQLDAGLIDSIINNNRAIDLEAAKTNFGDKLNVMQLVDGVLSGRVGRASQEFGNVLQGQSAQADSDFRRDQLGETQRQFDSQYGMDKFRTDEGLNLEGNNSALRLAEFLYGQQKDNRMLGLQELLGKAGIDLDLAKFGESKNQFNTATKLDLARLLEQVRQFDTSFGENQRQFNNNSAFNWSNLNANQMNNYLNTFMQAFG